MLRSTNKKVLEKIQAYIINGVDHEYFNLEADPDFNTVCKLILSACQNEKQYCRYNSDFEMFKDWAQGLPTAFNTGYYYNISAVDLLADWLEETDSEKAKFKESTAEEKITWLLYRELRKGAAK